MSSQTVNIQHSRFRDAPWFTGEESDNKIEVVIGGVGGIGSWVSLLLARAGFVPVLVDFDTLEEVNLAGQLFSRKSIGQKKVRAMADLIKEFSGDTVTFFDMNIEQAGVSMMAISCFDNMKARKTMFTNWLNLFKDFSKAIFIDGRLEAEQMWIYCVRGNDKEAIKNYSELLERDTDENTEEASCTMKQTSHAAAMIASHIVGFFTNHITNVREDDEIRIVPYEWNYFIPIHLSDS